MVSFEDIEGVSLHIVNTETVSAVHSTDQHVQGNEATCVIYFTGGQAVTVLGKSDEVANLIAGERAKWSAR